MHGLESHDRFSRRTGLRRALAAGGAGAVGAAALSASDAAAVAAGAPFIVVDATGSGAYTNLELAVKAAPAGAFVYVRPGKYVIADGDMDPAEGVRISGAGYGTWIQA